jgi:hypothetical protein
MPNNQRLEDFLELKDKNIWKLVKELERANFRLRLDISAGLADFASRTASEGVLIAKIISGKPLREREEYFLCEARFICRAIESGDKEVAERAKYELGYFQHCFLEDSEMKVIPLTYNCLKNLLESC